MPETQHTITAQTALPSDEGFDYSFVGTTARIALYDDLKAAPRITKIEPARTAEYIERLAATVDDQAKRVGGKIPYTVIREVSENFIHAQFREVVVSILDGGNTIRFADQGPGIQEKEKAQKPGFTSATEPMKEYIRGVGSGLPIVRDYLGVFDGSIIIEDNLNSGAVVTITLVKQPSGEPAGTFDAPETHAFSQAALANSQAYGENGAAGLPLSPGWSTGTPANQGGERAVTSSNSRPGGGMIGAAAGQGGEMPFIGSAAAGAPLQGADGFAGVSTGTIGGIPVITTSGVPAAYIPRPPLTDREQTFLKLLYREGELGVTEISKLAETVPSTTHNTLEKLAQAGLVQRGTGKKRTLTPLGMQIAPTLL